MKAKVIVVDGPSRGEVYETDAHRFLAMDTRPDATTILGTIIKEVTYHVHRYLFLGRMLRLASVEYDSNKISELDLFEVLASDKAKDAAR